MQSGTIEKSGKLFVLRWWEQRLENGALVRKRLRKVLGPATSTTVPPEIKRAAERHMADVGARKVPAGSMVKVGDFVETVFLPGLTKRVRPSTAKGYRENWHHWLKAFAAHAWVSDTRTVD